MMIREEYSTMAGATTILLFSTTNILYYVICLTTIAVTEVDTIERHYTTHYSTTSDTLVGQARMEKLERLIKSIEKQQ